MLAAWRVEGGERLWAVDLPSRVVAQSLVPADGSGRVIVVTGGSEPRFRVFGAADGNSLKDGRLMSTPSGEPAFGDGRIVVAGAEAVQSIPLKGGAAAGVSLLDPGSVVLDGQGRACVVCGSDLVGLDLLSGVRLSWRRALGGAVGVPAWQGGWLYAAHAPFGDAVPGIVCIDPETSDGAVAWRLPLPGLAPDALLAAGKSRLAVPVSPGCASALAVVDTVRRRVLHTVALDAPPAQPLVLADAGDGAAYVLDKKNRVSRIALKAGRISWTVELGATAYGPMVLADGVLLIPTDRGVAVLE
jgi:outer membrane protein assembly factor BamB